MNPAAIMLLDIITTATKAQIGALERFNIAEAEGRDVTMEDVYSQIAESDAARARFDAAVAAQE